MTWLEHCHVERKRNIAWKGKTVGLDFTEVYTPPNTTLPGDSSATPQNDSTYSSVLQSSELPRYCYSAINANAFETVVLAIRDLN